MLKTKSDSVKPGLVYTIFMLVPTCSVLGNSQQVSIIHDSNGSAPDKH